MNGPVPELDVAAAIAYSEEWRASQDRKAHEETAEGIADLLTSGHHGPTLAKMLHAHFPSARRGVVFSGIAIGVSWHQGNLALAQLEARLLRARLAEVGVDA